MRLDNGMLELDDLDLKEIFSLFTSCTQHEKEKIYTESDRLYFVNENLGENYEVNLEKREFAIDAWRAIVAFLHKKGFQFVKEGNVIDLSFISREFS